MPRYEVRGHINLAISPFELKVQILYKTSFISIYKKKKEKKHWCLRNSKEIAQVNISTFPFIGFCRFMWKLFEFLSFN